MALKPENPVVGGTALRRAAIRSPNFVTGSTGWSINQDGSAEFNNLVVRNGQIVSGTALYYSGPPAAGNLILAISAANGTDAFGNTYFAGVTMFNGHGAVVNLFSSTKSAFFQYRDLGSASQGGMILVVASNASTDPVTGASYTAGQTGIDPAFADSINIIGATIKLQQLAFSRQSQVGANTAANNASNPFIQVDAPEQGNLGHMQMKLQGTSPDGTRLGQCLIGQVSGGGALTPSTQGMLEVQGQVSGPPDPVIQVIGQSATDNSFGIRVLADAFNRLRIDASGKTQWGSGAAGQDITLQRISAGLLQLLATANTILQVKNPTATPAAPALQVIAQAAADAAAGIQIASDTTFRLAVDSNGTCTWGPGGVTATDTTLQRTGAGILSLSSVLKILAAAAPASPPLQVIGQAAGDRAIGVEVTGDTNFRFRIDDTGAMVWGPGNVGPDVTLQRSAANTLQLATADLDISTAGRGLKVAEGTNARMGTATLSGGTVVVSNTSVTASTRIFLTAQTSGAAPGALRVSARTAGTSFTITSTSATDTSVVAWLLVEPG